MRPNRFAFLFTTLLAASIGLLACTGDDNSLPLPPEAGAADAKAGDATTAPSDASKDAEKESDAGADAEQGLESLLPADLAILKEGRLRYSLLLNEDGGIVDDLMVTRRGGHWYMVVNGAVKYEDIAHLRENLPDEITINHLDDRALLALQGPKAFEVLKRIIPVALKAGKPGTPEFREGIRQAFLSEKEIVATQGIYNWTEKDRYGLDDRSRILLTVKDGKYVPAM